MFQVVYNAICQWRIDEQTQFSLNESLVKKFTFSQLTLFKLNIELYSLIISLFVVMNTFINDRVVNANSNERLSAESI